MLAAHKSTKLIIENNDVLSWNILTSSPCLSCMYTFLLFDYIVLLALYYSFNVHGKECSYVSYVKLYKPRVNLYHLSVWIFCISSKNEIIWLLKGCVVTWSLLSWQKRYFWSKILAIATFKVEFLQFKEYPYHCCTCPRHERTQNKRFSRSTGTELPGLPGFAPRGDGVTKQANWT